MNVKKPIAVISLRGGSGGNARKVGILISQPGGID
jgi:hypothetical protein